jgi:L-ribulokinase
MVMGTSGCHMLMSETEALVPGVAGIVRDGILPGYVGYETGQAAMGDGFDFIRRLTGNADFASITAAAASVPPGAGGVLALDWFNGCRTPLMDGGLKGVVTGLTLHTKPEELYRASLEASAFGLRWIVDTLRDGGVKVDRFVATGGLPSRNPLFASITASALWQAHHHPRRGTRARTRRGHPWRASRGRGRRWIRPCRGGSGNDGGGQEPGSRGAHRRTGSNCRGCL